MAIENNIAVIKRFFNASIQEIKALTKEDREELAKLIREYEKTE